MDDYNVFLNSFLYINEVSIEILEFLVVKLGWHILSIIKTAMSSYRGGSGGGGGAPKVRKVMTQAINLMFEFLKNVRCEIRINISLK